MKQSLSGRFLILTIIFVMLAEVFIFVPSVARFREDFLMARLERAQIASLALLATDGMIDDALEAELLQNADVLNVVLRRDAVRQLILSTDDIPPISGTYDLRDAGAWELIRDAILRIAEPDNQTIRIIGEPVRDAGILIEVTMYTEGLRAALIDYGIRILILSTFISVFTAALLFLAVRRLLVTPIKRVVSHMTDYAAAPHDSSRIIEPEANVRELHEAEVALRSMQTQLTSALKQRERLVQLGQAVAKISHDLRNILTVTTLMADRLEGSEDPAVKRTTPKLVASLTRAVNLTEATLAFGKAEEPPPTLSRVELAALVDDVIENDRLAADEDTVAYHCDVPRDLRLRADPEQLFRILSNLVRNAREAIVAGGTPGEIRIEGREDEDGWRLNLCDSGPGLPQKAREFLFQPFQGTVRKGGTGLGLTIAQELVRGHGGRLELEKSDQHGTTFTIFLPRGMGA